MVAKPILRVGKIKATGRVTPQSVLAHFARTRSTPNADPQRTKSNRWIVNPGPDLGAAIDHVTRRAGIDPAKRRKDAVIASDILLTISPEWFRPDNPEQSGTWEDDRLTAFQAEAEQMLRETFGPRLVAAVLHLDEATPHIQAVVVPILPGKTDRQKLRLSGKDFFNPKALSSLQQRWEDRMRPHGVGPRVKGSKARHTTLREYYGALEATKSDDARPRLVLSDPPEKGRLESQESYADRVKDWKQSETKKIRNELRPLARDASRGRLYDAERRSGTELRTMARDLRAEIAEATRERDLSKEDIGRLRSMPINQVAAALDYNGEIGRKENPIDLVKRVGGLDYREAVTWLAQRFGPEAAAAAYRDEAAPKIAASAEGAPVLSKAEKTKTRIARKQLDALAASEYRVTLMSERDGSQVGRNFTKDSDGTEQLLSQNGLIERLPELALANARGENIFITPIENGMHFVLIDDLDAPGIETLRQRGYTPATITESSHGNFQAVIKVPESSGSKADVNSWFRDLNQDLGDQKITGLRHPFRLAGFENRKPKHKDPETGRYPFIRLVTAVNQLCSKASEVIQRYAVIRKQPLQDNPDEPETGPRLF